MWTLNHQKKFCVNYEIWKFVFHFLLRKISIIYRGRPNSIISLQIHITLLQQRSTHSQSVSLTLSSTSSPFVLLGNIYVWKCFECYAQLIKCRMYEINRTNKHDLVSKIFGEIGTRKRNRLVWFWPQNRQRTSTGYWWHFPWVESFDYRWGYVVSLPIKSSFLSIPSLPFVPPHTPAYSPPRYLSHSSEDLDCSPQRLPHLAKAIATWKKKTKNPRGALSIEIWCEPHP